MREKGKGVAVCETCEDVVSVWIKSGSRIEPISPEGVCSCGDPSLRLLNGEGLDDE